MRMGLVGVVLVVMLAGCRPPGWGRDEVDAAPTGDAPRGTDGVTGDAAPPDAAPRCMASFRLDGHAGASTVWLTGDFVAWAGDPAAGAVELMRDGNGVWSVVRGFADGSYQYKFIVDAASWIPDPGNPDQVPDGFGGFNSVYTCP